MNIHVGYHSLFFSSSQTSYSHNFIFSCHFHVIFTPLPKIFTTSVPPKPEPEITTQSGQGELLMNVVVDRLEDQRMTEEEMTTDPVTQQLLQAESVRSSEEVQRLVDLEKYGSCRQILCRSCVRKLNIQPVEVGRNR